MIDDGPFQTYHRHATSFAVRFWLGFAVLAIWLFGWLCCGCVLALTGRPFEALAVLALALISGRLLPKPIAHLTMLGVRR